MNSPNAGIPYVPENTLNPAAGLNEAIDVLDVLTQTAVIAMDMTAPPGTSADGDLYVVGSPATGVWTGKENFVARFVLDGHFWKFYEPGVQVHYLLDHDSGEFFKWDETVSPAVWAQLTLSDATISVEDEDSPPQIVTPVTEIVLGSGLTLQDLGGNRVRIASTGGGGGGGGNVTPDTHPAFPAILDDEFEDGSLDSKWGFVNQSGASEVLVDGALRLTGSTASGTTNYNLLVQTAPGAPWKIRAKCHIIRGATNAAAGLCFYNTANQNGLMFGLAYTSSAQTLNYYAQRIDDPTTFNSNVAGPSTLSIGPVVASGAANVPVYLEIENDGTNLICRFSISGIDGTYVLAYSETIAAFLSAVDRTGVFIHSVSTSTAALVAFDWFRDVT